MGIVEKTAANYSLEYNELSLGGSSETGLNNWGRPYGWLLLNRSMEFETSTPHKRDGERERVCLRPQYIVWVEFWY